MAKAILHGIVVSTGIAIGKGFFLNRAPTSIRHTLIALDRIEAEVVRLQGAVDAVATEFAEARACLPKHFVSHAEVLDSHLLICKDSKLSGPAVRHIREQRMNAEWALEESVARLGDTFSRMASPYFRERMEDVRLVADRIMQRLGGNKHSLPDGERRGVLLAHALSPVDAVGLNSSQFFSFALERGGQTSHVGILARSLCIPAVVGVSGLEAEVAGGELLIVDALKGRLIVEPTEEELAEYVGLQARFEEYQQHISTRAFLPAESEDGQRVTVLANIKGSAEIQDVLNSGGEGVGLVRTEFSYFASKRLPNEEELYNEYKYIVKSFAPRKVVFRTLDVGGEKLLACGKPLVEDNPALGVRAIRYCLTHQDIFRTQLRAILRASVYGNVALMFPLISGVSELRFARSVLNEAKQELDAAYVPFNRNLPVGIMVELPSAVLTADLLAREVDFFSIGTNDLIQYSLGADRGNPYVAHIYQPLHPAIVRAIKLVVDMAHKEGISVSVCGEMAADPYCLPILLGMSVDELSLAPQSIPAVKHLIRNSNAQEYRDILTYALSTSTAHIVSDMVRQTLYARFPEDVSFFASQADAEH